MLYLRKLEWILENAHDTADKNMDGGFVAPYRRGVEREMDQLQELIRKIRNI